MAVITELNVEGMTCTNCARHVTEALRETPGVERATVDLSTNSARVVWSDAAQADPVRAIASVVEAGYQANVAEAAPQRASAWSPLQGWTFNVVFGSIATIPMLILEWVFGLGMERWYHWLAFALATPVQLLCGSRFYRGAWLQAKSGGSNMDTLVALGSTTAYAFSAYQLFRGAHGHLYFMDAAAIITLISVGHWLEAKVSVRAEETLKSLLRLAPETARRLSAGREEEVPVSSLHPNDSVAIRPGDRIPTDGEVTDGQSAVDESMLTGESIPVEKNPGAKLFAGSINSDGRLVMRVTALGEETALARIIEVVRHAQTSRANIQRLGDRISAIFVPIVIVLAVVTALWWGLAPERAAATAHWLGQFFWHPHIGEGGVGAAVFHTAAVLIIACPCAMGLATPIAIMAGANAAAKRGILIRDGQALEKSGSITTVLFDKTGTLTEGKLTLAAFESFAERAQPLAASLAAASRHPLSQAISATTHDRVPLANWQEHRGSGISASLQNQTARLGSVNWLRSLGVDTARAEAFTQKWTSEGSSVLLLAIDQQLAGAIALTDALKPNALEIIDSLRAQGKKVALVTGDHSLTAAAIGKRLSIEDVFAEVRPERKAEILQQLQSRGERVAFVGDGINDAPALAAADLGIAMGSGADAARQAADIILLRAGLEGIPEALGLAQATLRTIKQNLFWAFFYNAAGVPLAMAGLFSPILSAAAMGISDLLVIGNALRLRRWKR